MFVKRGERLALESWHPHTTLGEVRQRTGFAFDATGAGSTPMITASEQAALAGLDPDGGFEREAAITPIIAS